jgi:hypothetical protein
VLRTAGGVYVSGVLVHPGGNIEASSATGGAYTLEALDGLTGWGEWVGGADVTLTPGEREFTWKSEWYSYGITQYITGYVLAWTDIAPGGLGDLDPKYGGGLLDRIRLLHPLRPGVLDGTPRWRVRGTGAVS